MIKKYFKKYKLNKIQQIKQTSKYIYIFRYNDLTINENIFLKKKIKELNFKSLILKQNLINNFFLKINGQGSILIIYGNSNINIVEKLIKLKKIELIYLITNNNIFSNLKLKKKNLKKEIPLNISIMKTFFHFLYALRKI